MISHWHSPITPTTMSGDHRLYDVRWTQDALIWHERRTSGAALVMSHPGDPARDLMRDTSIGGRVLYGGGGFNVSDMAVFYVGGDARIYRLPLGRGLPKPITPAFGGAAAPTPSPDGRWVAFVHTYEGRDALAVVPADGSQYPRKILDGTDFVMHPAWSADGRHLACVTWDHPHMPWDVSQLHLLALDEGAFVTGRHVIAGAGWDESVFGAAFSPDGRFLAYASDRAGWWHIYLHDMSDGSPTQITDDEAEYGTPAWLQEMRTFAWTGDSRALYALRSADSSVTLQRIEIASGVMKPVTALNEYTHMEQVAVSPQTGEVALIAGASHIPDRVVSYDPQTDAVMVRAHSSTERIPTDYLSHSEVVQWEVSHESRVAGLYYRPTHPQHEVEEAPPLIVHIHSGPTRQRFRRYFPEVHFFTSRGYAVLEPNFRGSTGYGRDFKNLLRGNYGVYEVEDGARGAEFLAGQGLADRQRLIVMGSSSGGFSALQSLILMPSVYRAAIAQAPVTDQFGLAMDTHKFERFYNDSLLGALPDAANLYRERSPLRHARRISDPVALFHGADDKVVPPSQSQAVADVLRRNNVPHVFKLYEGEGHSFRQPETKRDYYETILNFLAQYVTLPSE